MNQNMQPPYVKVARARRRRRRQHAQNSARRNEDLSVPDVAHNEYNFVNEPIISKEGNCANALDDQDVDSSIYSEFSHEVLVDKGAFYHDRLLPRVLNIGIYIYVKSNSKNFHIFYGNLQYIASIAR